MNVKERLCEEKTMYSNLQPLSIAFDEDPQDRLFEEMVKLWVDGKITYSKLMESFPDYDESMILKILRSLERVFA